MSIAAAVLVACWHLCSRKVCYQSKVMSIATAMLVVFSELSINAGTGRY